MGCGASKKPPPAAPVYMDPNPPIAIDIVSMFKALDVNGDGAITLDELSTYLKDRGNRQQEEIDAMFKILDKNADGKVTKEEVTQAFAEVEGGPSPLADMMAERPAPSAKLFDELAAAKKNKDKSAVCIDLSEERAITIKQLGLAFKHASVRCRDESWLGKRPDESGKWHFVRLSAATVNLYDLCAHVIMPATHRATLPGKDIYPSYVELVADGPQPPEYFVSHFWGERVIDFIACLKQHSIDREVGGGLAPVFITGASTGIAGVGGIAPPTAQQFNQGKFSMVNASSGVGDNNADRPWEAMKQPHNKFAQMPKPGENATYWVCAYANRQWDLGSDVTEDPAQSSFSRAIRRSKGTVAILDTAGTYWSRIWCDYEVYIALEGAPDASYTFDVYTATPGAQDQCAFIHTNLTPLYKEAVGLLDGVAPCDVRAMFPAMAGMMKLRREANFPVFQQKGGMAARLQQGTASMASDRTHILNAICGNNGDSAALNAEPPAEHAAYNKVNKKLNGRIAAKSFVPACRRGDVEMANAIIEALSDPEASVTRIELNFAEIEMEGKPTEDAQTAGLLAKLVSMLPPTLEVLAIQMTPDLKDLSTLVQTCPKLCELNLQGCVNLPSLPDLSPLAPTLKMLDLSCCEELAKGASPSGLDQLKLDVYEQPTGLPGFQQLMAKQLTQVFFPGMPDWMVKKAAAPLITTLKRAGVGKNGVGAIKYAGDQLCKAVVPPGMVGGMQVQMQTPKGLMNVPIPPGLQPGQEFEFII